MIFFKGGKVLVYANYYPYYGASTDHGIRPEVIDLLDESKTCVLDSNVTYNSFTVHATVGGKIGENYIFCGGKLTETNGVQEKNIKHCYQIGEEAPIGNLQKFRRWAGGVNLPNDTLFITGIRNIQSR